VLDALVAVEMRGHESKGRTVVKREWFAVQGIGEKDLLVQQVVEQNAGAVSVESLELHILAVGGWVIQHAA
jgi:hypothetical protein